MFEKICKKKNSIPDPMFKIQLIFDKYPENLNPKIVTIYI